MAVKLRLVRMGKKKQPTYRVVAADSRSPRDGRFLEIVGTYAPRGRSTADQDAVVTIDNAKAVKWLSRGAKPTERVERLLRTSGAWDEFTTPGAVASGNGTTAEAAAAPVGTAEPAGDQVGGAATDEPATGEASGGPDSTTAGEGQGPLASEEPGVGASGGPDSTTEAG